MKKSAKIQIRDLKPRKDAKGGAKLFESGSGKNTTSGSGKTTLSRSSSFTNS